MLTGQTNMDTAAAFINAYRPNQQLCSLIYPILLNTKYTTWTNTHV